MGFWSKLFGREAEIDSSTSLPVRPDPRLVGIQIDVDTAGASKAVGDLEQQAKLAMKAVDAAISRAHTLKKLAAYDVVYGKRPGKPKSRSQKKPARKRSRK